MSRGAGDDRRRLVISAACGTESVALRSRTPLRNPGRVLIETDAPGNDGELTVDLVPGPVDLVETSPRGGMPPGTLRIRVTPASVKIGDAPPIPIPEPHNDISTRWEFALGADGVHAWRNGVEIGAAPVVPTWTEATPLFSFTGPANGLNFVGIDAIGISGKNTPNLILPPRLTTTGGTAGGTPLPDQLGGQLRLTVRSYYGQTIPGPFSVEIGGRTFPARPAVEGQPFEPGIRFPLVADLPADAVLVNSRNELAVSVHSADPARTPQVQHADIELVADHNSYTAPKTEPVARPKPLLAVATGVLLDASGAKIENDGTSPRGRIVLEITFGGSGDLAGLAGVELWVDNKRIAAIPTNRDGPGVAGRLRLALNTTSFQPGVRDIEIKAISTDAGTSPQTSALPWQIPA
jgi:hypothetical protein